MELFYITIVNIRTFPQRNRKGGKKKWWSIALIPQIHPRHHSSTSYPDSLGTMILEKLTLAKTLISYIYNELPYPLSLKRHKQRMRKVNSFMKRWRKMLLQGQMKRSITGFLMRSEECIYFIILSFIYILSFCQVNEMFVLSSTGS